LNKKVTNYKLAPALGDGIIAEAFTLSKLKAYNSINHKLRYAKLATADASLGKLCT
jgi:hypothetical protein